MNRLVKAAAVMVALLAASVVLLFAMPAESDELVDQAITYGSVALYVVSAAMAGVVVYFRRVDGKIGKEQPAGEEDLDEEYVDEISEIEREFEALEKEIEREESS
ncbi:TPA: hypothetical protein HA259_07520 [Thermoplasmata archaeon]|nr:hypothetical protein [Thermoplasmata archaeon]